MLLKLKNLNESLEKKYPINEAWSESMPDWMKNRMNITALDKDPNKVKKLGRSKHNAGYFGDTFRNKFGVRGDTSEYRKPRDREGGFSLFRGFIKKGIDLNNVSFIEGPIPEKKSDPRIQSPNIGIWHFGTPPNDQVWAMGINDDEKFNQDVKSRPFIKIPFKTIVELANAFCYIDGSTLQTRDYDDIRQKRYDFKRWEIDPKNQAMRVKPGSRESNPYGWRLPGVVADKSGYYVIPPSSKYAEELKKRHAKEYGNDLTELESELKSVFSNIQDVSMSWEWDDNDLSTRGLDNILYSYRNALSYYRNALSTIDRIVSVYGKDTEKFLSMIPDSGFPELIKTAKEYIEECKKRLKGRTFTTLDF